MTGADLRGQLAAEVDGPDPEWRRELAAERSWESARAELRPPYRLAAPAGQALPAGARP